MLMALLAFAVLGIFLLVLVYFVPSPDLICVVLLTVALVAYDFVTSARTSG
jgi:hypothetical protein